MHSGPPEDPRGSEDAAGSVDDLAALCRGQSAVAGGGAGPGGRGSHRVAVTRDGAALASCSSGGRGGGRAPDHNLVLQTYNEMY